LDALLDFHNKSGKLATMTAVNVGQQFGCLEIGENSQILRFREKSDNDGSLINGGYMVLEPKVFDYIEGDKTIFERDPIEALARDGELNAFIHSGFWKCMDTKRDKEKLEELIDSGNAPWVKWEE